MMSLSESLVMLYLRMKYGCSTGLVKNPSIVWVGWLVPTCKQTPYIYYYYLEKCNNTLQTCMYMIMFVSFLASFPVLPHTRFTFTCNNCGGEHFETGKAWYETSREVDVVLYNIIIVQVPLPPGVYLPVLYI